ncbi:Cell wall transcription factor ACE2 like protein [Verticillium longisporum]|uniref:Cell wall transcription factor ACE2 like protein n=2 Tax=Verticillium TaxID=1036719 RepID=A0A0G4NMK0_VERLO|nr:Cell wall transcription factor ACE2 like protein [Verticillium longisporum]CRK38442.1 hypothetical protein BN1708_007765 [Verticillium longisporum]CRK47688.1 hypothetical protein BN1723_007707 [Verticillium longisporum]
MMSVVYEPRSFMHDPSYPPIGDPDQDHDVDTRLQYASPDVSGLDAYNPSASMLGDDRSIISDALGGDGVLVTDAGELTLPPAPTMATLASQMPETLPSNGGKDDLDHGASSLRSKCIPKPDREVHKQADGKFYCTFPGCTEDTQVFGRKCEWSKHMDKHERPYRCAAEGCEKLPGFTYSGGLLRHEREVHGKHGGPKNTVNCPHPNCKRHTGKGFSRQENLNEHLRRVHTQDGSTPIGDDIATSDGDSEKAGQKRKRSRKNSASDPYDDLREEIKRVRMENEELRDQIDRQSQHSLAMMAQIAELQETLRGGNLDVSGLGVDTSVLNAPTASMM